MTVLMKHQLIIENMIMVWFVLQLHNRIFIYDAFIKQQWRLLMNV